MKPFKQVLRRTAGRVALAAAAAAVSGSALADQVRWIVPFPAGGGSDIVARLVTTQIEPLTKDTIIVENRPGGATIIATRGLLSAPADGNTVMSGNDALAVNPNLYKDLPFSIENDFDFVSLLARVPLVLVTRNDFPVNNVQEALAYMKSKGDTVTYASWGVGSLAHLTMEALADALGVNPVHVPYQGTAPALQDLVGGQVDFMFADIPGGLPMIQAGRIKPLVISTGQRSAILPEIPTVAETAVPGFDYFSWQGAITRKGIPEARRDQLSAAIRTVLTSDKIQQEFASRGLEPWPTTSAEFREQVLALSAKLKVLMEKREIRLE